MSVKICPKSCCDYKSFNPSEYKVSVHDQHTIFGCLWCGLTYRAGSALCKCIQDPRKYSGRTHTCVGCRNKKADGTRSPCLVCAKAKTQGYKCPCCKQNGKLDFFVPIKDPEGLKKAFEIHGFNSEC